MNRRELFAVLSRRPEGRWPEGTLHHGVRLLLLAALAVGVTVLFPVTPVPDLPLVERGMVLDEDLVAQIDFQVLKADDRLERERQDAAATVIPIFVYDTTAVDSMLAGVDRFFARVDSAMSGVDAEEGRRRVRDLLGSYAIPPSPSELSLVVDSAWRQELQRGVRQVILDELPRGIVRSGDLEDAGSQSIRVIGMDRDRTVPTDSVLQMTDFYRRSQLNVPAAAPDGYEQMQRLLLVRFNVPSLNPDWSRTEALRTRWREAVDPVETDIVRGQRVVPAREPVNEQHMQRYRSYRAALDREGQLGTDPLGQGPRLFRTLGSFLYNLIVLSLFGVLLFFYRPALYENLRHVSLLWVLMATVLVIAALTARYGQPATLIPIAFPALVVAILWDGRLALNLSLILAILLSGQAPFLGIATLLTLVAGGAVAALAVRVVRRRAQIWGFIGLITGAYVVVGLVLALLQGWSLMEVGVSSGWGALNALASAFATMGFLPIFEGYTRITTDQTLLELADMNRPLLRRLSLEAPGTYAHSINVANLAEAAAAAIGANALLTRVGVYYHDVGKIDRPHYFIENQLSGRNPHDRLKPATSAQVVRNHVLEGLKLAEDEKLPHCVKAFIAEHHGTQSISFFYDQAKESDPDSELDPKDFAYPGPRPRTRETAIVMLADSVESAARVLPDPTPASIRELVDRIVRVKMEARQLDEAPLTLTELSRIKEQFVSVLSGMYHQRIDYPPTRERVAETAANAEEVEDAATRDAAAAQAEAR
jgi:putative nucleotidyltransferase with HDIG domain